MSLFRRKQHPTVDYLRGYDDGYDRALVEFEDWYGELDVVVEPIDEQPVDVSVPGDELEGVA